MMKLSSALLLVNLFISAGCAHAPGPPVTEAGARVDVSKGDPPAGMTELGAFEAADPLACTSDGRAGTEEAAMATLRNRAAELGADYVQVFRTDTDQCKRVVIRAMMFKRAAADTGAAPTPSY